MRSPARGWILGTLLAVVTVRLRIIAWEGLTPACIVVAELRRRVGHLEILPLLEISSGPAILADERPLFRFVTSFQLEGTGATLPVIRASSERGHGERYQGNQLQMTR